jgi:hypothetical protein
VHANRAAELFRVPLILNFKPEVIVGVIPKIDPRLEQWIIRMLAPEAARKEACLESEFRSNQITESLSEGERLTRFEGLPLD